MTWLREAAEEDSEDEEEEEALAVEKALAVVWTSYLLQLWSCRTLC